MEESLLDKIGGESSLTKIVDEFYKRALDDPRIKNRFSASDVEELKRKETNFLSGLIKSGQPHVSGALAEAHRGKGITKHEFNLVLSLYEEALKEQSLTNSAIQQFLELLGSVRVDVEGL